MNPLYVAKKSKLASFTLLRILFFWLIVPLILIILDIVRANIEKVEFYDNKVIEKTGIISKNEKNTIFKGVVSVSVNQGILGRLFRFGEVHIDLVGKNNLYLDKVKNPYELKKFLETKIIDVDDSQTTLIG